MPANKNIKSSGFSLVEMAVVLVIVGLLLAGLLIPITAQIDLRNYRDTKAEISLIKEAVIGFTLANGRMPCPADPTIPGNNINAGDENCTLESGIVPWKVLGVGQVDAWGRRITYRVTPSFSDGILANTIAPPATCTFIPLSSSFALCSEGGISINDGGVIIAAKVPAVIVSHGKNGFGAYLSDGTQLAANGSLQETENSNGDTNFTSSQSVTVVFDDVVDWVSVNVLFNRMVSIGKLP